MTNPLRPSVRRGALVTVSTAAPSVIVATAASRTVIPFQYNPSSLSRSLEPQVAGDGGVDALRLAGAPAETIKVEVIIDGFDDMEDGQPSTVIARLAQLELLLYPASTWVTTNQALLSSGTIEIVPPQATLTLFVWGPKRVVPVRITEYSVTEEAFDTDLEPIRATVSLGMRVISYSDVPGDHPAHGLFLSHQQAKEGLAKSRPSTAMPDAIASLNPGSL